ncbi:MAG: arsenosugar biosynthesis radical SAM protein ArsS [Deltaproteobacteria bacterium]|nr:arsenosugar biosynthesis radical SAM protein ArsS [Deltaproteobacteria bacterium]
MSTFEKRISEFTGGGLFSDAVEVLQVNLGLKCNRACAHCHLQASPDRTEQMEWSVMETILAALGDLPCRLVDLTGGAPELNPHFRRFVTALTGAGHQVQVRTNLSVLVEPELGDLPAFLREHRVALVGSMPCYLEQNVNRQRGDGAYSANVAAIRTLNELDYGRDPELQLNLVYNPGGAFLPPDQQALQTDYARELETQHGVQFTNLLTITNMPLGRFLDELREAGAEATYKGLLEASFNPRTIDGLMCRHQLSVGWDGTLYDCDFNLALQLPVDHGAPDHITRIDAQAITGRQIVTGDHCFGCTAGSGSSCAGALVDIDNG